MADGTLEELAEQAATEDSDALSRLVEQVQHLVYRLALRFLGHPEDAKDASQEILVRLITHLGSFEGRSQFMTWAYSVAVRQLMRSRKRQLESSVQGPETFAGFLDRGLAEHDFTAKEAEYRLLCAEVRYGNPATGDAGVMTETHALRIADGLIIEHIVGDNAFHMPYQELVLWKMPYRESTPDPSAEIASAVAASDEVTA
jgi:RNA polymerase sigma factor (sigma-70 family)